MRARAGAPVVRWAAVTLALALVLTGCTVTPAPPVQDTTKKTTTTAPARSPRAVTVALAELGTGFNPHLLADLSPVATAMTDLVLPSVFRPGVDGGAPVLDTSVAVSASVSSIAPFTVTYVLRDAAQWSDGAPIAAEDFRYLWSQMRTQPGVVDAAGYQLIDDVSSSSGGKTVTVRFSAPYPAWRTLFSALLPNHLLKDAPGGFTGALKTSIAFSGSRYAVASVDTDRGEVL
ncbi:MAG: ABC transporter substrate-binding protein, partial [Mycobacteriaceae bacterium]